MKIINQIAQSRSQFSPSELKIAETILAHQERISKISSSELAQLAAVSQSSIVKFVQKIGFKGMTAFRLALSEESGRQQAIQLPVATNFPLHNAINSDDDAPTIARKLMQEKIRALVETTGSVDYEILGKIVTALSEARFVHITGLGGSMTVGSDFAHKLLKIGVIALIGPDSHAQLSIANTLGPQDIQVAISYSGRRKEILDAARVAQQRKARVIALTNPVENPLRALADLSLVTLAEEDQWRSSAISSRTAQNALTDLIFMVLIQTQSWRNDLIRDTQSLIDELM